MAKYELFNLKHNNRDSQIYEDNIGKLNGLFKYASSD